MKLILFVSILVVLFLIWYFRPNYVKLKLLATIQNDQVTVNNDAIGFNSELHWWFIDSYYNLDAKILEAHVSPDANMLITNSENLKNWKVDFNELGIDFNKNNVILAFSREIKEMKFKRTDWFPYHTISTVRTIMSKKFKQNTIYIYKISKYDVREDLRAYTETFLEND